VAEPSQQTGRCHLLIRGGRIIDGSGGPGYAGDVAVEGDRIAAVGELSAWRADESIDAAGRVVAPGFIDVHTHDDLAVIDDPGHEAKVSQGVTTVIGGNCGVSLAPIVPPGKLHQLFGLLGADAAFRYSTLTSYRDAVDKAKPAVNISLFVGHTTLRAEAMGSDIERPATEAERKAMAERLHVAMGEGALGLSTGLDYPPARQAPTSEIIELARELKAFPGAVYVSHIRNEGEHVLDAVDETLEIGRAASRMAVISHHKCAGKANYGRSRETLARIEEAAMNQAVGLDLYPYRASSTVLAMERVRGADSVIVTGSERHPEVAGRTLDDIARTWECTEEEAVDRLHPAGAVYFSMDEADVERIMAYGKTMIGSDGLPSMDHPHPRLWGTFPRVLGRYVRERGIISLEQAVYKMTGLSAETFGLLGRGLLAPGNVADIIVFDPDTIIDRATFETPRERSEGILEVLVAGRPVWKAGEPTAERPGGFLARSH